MGRNNGLLRTFEGVLIPGSKGGQLRLAGLALLNYQHSLAGTRLRSYIVRGFSFSLGSIVHIRRLQ